MRDLARRLLVAPATRALIGGFLMAMGGPPFPAAILALSFLGVISFASALDGARVWQGARRGLLFGFGANIVAMSFVPATITRFTDLPWAAAMLALLLLAIGQGAVFAVAGALVGLANRRRFPLPFSFAAGVGASMLVPALFPWTIAAPLGRAPVFMQLAEIVGERGVSVLLAALAALVARAFAERGVLRRNRLAFVFATFLAMLVYGVVRMRMIDAARANAPERNVALIQQAVPPKERWQEFRFPSIVDKLWKLTREAEKQGAEIAIWPESAYPYILAHAAQRESGPFRIRGPGITIEVVTGLLTDAPPPAGAEPGSRWSYNATALVDRTGHVAQPTAKIELLAFGEVVPLGDWFPALRRIFSRGGGLVPGKEPVALVTPSQPTARIGVLNCYEDTLGGVARRVMAVTPNLLVNVTNDAWFGATAEPELHMLESIPRTIEARRDLVRAVNTGVTAHIDANGRVVARAEREVATILLVKPRLLELGPTPYVRFGDASWMILLLVTGVFITIRARRA